MVPAPGEGRTDSATPAAFGVHTQIASGSTVLSFRSP
jgi:hypothetical protein